MRNDEHHICFTGKEHVCRFVGCGRNDRFNYVVMELQVGPLPFITIEAFCFLSCIINVTCNTHFLRGGIWQICAEP